MTTHSRKSSKAESEQRREHRYLNAQGAEVKTRDEAFAPLQDVTAEALAVPVKLQLNNGATTFEMELRINPNTYPFTVTGGRITSGICGAPWDITGGSIGNQLRLDAKRAGQGSCANTITIVGQYQNPPSYRGTYGFDGASSSFNHTTLYQI
ncbi:hypothetical protein GCM10010329_10070 [Streptomyces spiroverticillatus]|uniref:Uncharacterized protein n=1 Tax=Streptomyces finlayi TaxID=67296 RepID=A0A918WXZ9_9ACTN|nr:hypothetical protein [Streptomyces finlayi]GGZ91624.1 hypothetical protein GCM10010329_10070 [Streptomyces spiroverticillatus]GHC93673.1 hypothetical protein GCM10010334_31020 [Streptomyces finlayi]